VKVGSVQAGLVLIQLETVSYAIYELLEQLLVGQLYFLLHEILHPVLLAEFLQFCKSGIGHFDCIALLKLRFEFFLLLLNFIQFLQLSDHKYVKVYWLLASLLPFPHFSLHILQIVLEFFLLLFVNRVN